MMLIVWVVESRNSEMRFKILKIACTTVHKILDSRAQSLHKTKTFVLMISANCSGRLRD